MRAPAVAVSLAAAFVFILALGACSGGAGGALLLDWRFADGRDCVNAGATRVELRLTPPAPGDSALATLDCAAGLAPATVTTARLPGEGTLYLDARSPYDGDLYGGELSLDDTFAVTTGAPATATVTLYAAAAN